MPDSIELTDEMVTAKWAEIPNCWANTRFVFASTWLFATERGLRWWAQNFKDQNVG